MKLFELQERQVNKVLILGGVHGNEKTGVHIARSFIPMRSQEIIVVPCLNLSGFKENTREHQGIDLNRAYNQVDEPEQVRLIKDIVNKVSLVIDVHSTPVDMLDSACCLVHDDTEHFGECFGVELVQQDPPEGSLREFCNERGIPIITYEAVEHDQVHPQEVELGIDGILKILAKLELN